MSTLTTTVLQVTQQPRYTVIRILQHYTTTLYNYAGGIHNKRRNSERYIYTHNIKLVGVMYTDIIITTVYDSKCLRDFTEALHGRDGGRYAPLSWLAIHCLKCIYSLHTHPAASAVCTQKSYTCRYYCLNIISAVYI